MRKILVLISLVLIPFLADAQFEQKLSFNLSVGTFKTFGKKMGQYDPMQMPNYGMGLSVNAGLQFRISNHFSLVADFERLSSNKWDYHEGDNNSFLYWSIYDPQTTLLLAEGEGYLDLRNISIGIKPKYYFLQGKKWNPYFYAGINFNWTSTWCENTEWAERKKLDVLPPEDTGPTSIFLETSSGIGFNPGFGIEYNPFSRMCFYLSPGYYFISLNKKNFKSPAQEENFNAFVIQAGLRLNFIKSKEL
jgi:opacity protein-like surface antigen